LTALKIKGYKIGSILFSSKLVSKKSLSIFFFIFINKVLSDKFGHKSSKPDFGIPSLKLLIEVKFIRDQTEFKKIENEIKIDAIDYLKHPNYNKLIVFIYDNSASVQEHQITKEALKRIDGIKDVIIASKPSHIDDSK